MKLISMRDFVLEQYEIKFQFRYKAKQTSNRIENYAIFLKQPLELWMFVPCDEDGNVMEVPQPTEGDECNWNYQARFNEYQQAKERCLFVWQKGFDYKVICEMFKDLEDIILFEFELTETAQKQIFG